MATGIFFPSVVAMEPSGGHGAGVSMHGHHHQDDDGLTQDQEAPQPMVQGDDNDEEEVEVGQAQESGHHTGGHVEEQGIASQRGTESPGPQVTAMELGAAALTLGRRITLKPRRTLSLSPTTARTSDGSMGRNLRAATCLDFTDKDDDDGLNRGAQDSDCEDDDPVNNYKKKGGEVDDDDDAASITSTEGDLNPKARCMISRGSGARTVHSNTFPRRSNPISGQKRPLESSLVAACQEIQYLDISYQKVSTSTVPTPEAQFSPIPSKKIAYHPILHIQIHYCDVTYIAPGAKEPSTSSSTSVPRRKPPQRSHSFAAIGERGLREKLGTVTEPLFRSQWASGISREHQYGPSHSIRAAAVAVSTEYSR